MDDRSEKRWGGYIPWFLKHSDFSGQGNFSTFFSRLSQRLERLFMFNEPELPNLPHFGARLESESLQRFRFDPSGVLSTQIRDYFNPELMNGAAYERAQADPEEAEANKLLHKWDKARLSLHIENRSTGAIKRCVEAESQYTTALNTARQSRPSRVATHFRALVVERISALEALLRILPRGNVWVQQLIDDVRRFAAEANIMLDIEVTEAGPVISPLEERLLQSEVLDKLMPRLSAHFPGRAAELINAYHMLVAGEPADRVFTEAFKTLEAIARDLTGDKNFMFDREHLNQQFSGLHRTVQNTLIQLAAHRGDKGAHGRDAPPPHEIRFLLFAVCNAALLLLDYQE